MKKNILAIVVASSGIAFASSPVPVITAQAKIGNQSPITIPVNAFRLDEHLQGGTAPPSGGTALSFTGINPTLDLRFPNLISQAAFVLAIQAAGKFTGPPPPVTVYLHVVYPSTSATTPLATNIEVDGLTLNGVVSANFPGTSAVSFTGTQAPLFTQSGTSPSPSAGTFDVQFSTFNGNDVPGGFQDYPDVAWVGLQYQPAAPASGWIATGERPWLGDMSLPALLSNERNDPNISYLYPSLFIYLNNTAYNWIGTVGEVTIWVFNNYGDKETVTANLFSGSGIAPPPTLL